MKHMWSEEELQTFSKDKIKLEDITDYKGHNRFIEGLGEAYPVDGLETISSKWVLNGTNLIIEMFGTFTQNVNNENLLCRFELPKWVIDKIPYATGGIIDIIQYTCASLESGTLKTNAILILNANNIVIAQVGNISITNPVFFKIRYNIIIDTE